MKHGWQTAWHAVTLGVVLATLALQLWLSVTGPTFGEALWTRLWHQLSYFTIQSNIIVALGVAPLVKNPLHRGTSWAVVRSAGLLGISVTALVHYFVLRPLIDVQGLAAIAGNSLHVVVPLLTIVGWLVFGPRPRLPFRVLLRSMLWPVGWLVYTLVIGAITGWYPYPFINAAELGYPSVLLASGIITLIFFALAAVIRLLDSRLPEPLGSSV